MTEPPDDPTAPPRTAAARRARLRLVPPLSGPGESGVSRIPEHSRLTSPAGEPSRPRAPLRAVDPLPIQLRRPPLPPDDPPRGAA